VIKPTWQQAFPTPAPSQKTRRNGAPTMSVMPATSKKPGPPIRQKPKGEPAPSSPPALAVEHCGSLDIRVTHVVPDKLRPYYFYRPNRPSTNPGKSWLPIVAGKLDFGRVGASSATDLPMLCVTGVAIKAWMLPICGPLCTIAMPEICPRSLILFAMTARRLEL
jgi:hypothetical protein